VAEWVRSKQTFLKLTYFLKYIIADPKIFSEIRRTYHLPRVMNNVHSSCLQWQKYTGHQPGSVQWDACWWGNIQSGTICHVKVVLMWVCKAFFHRVLCLTDGRNAHAMKLKVHGLPHSDRREKHIPHNKTQANCGYVKDFINKFPSYSSHYSRNKHPNRSYLAPDLNTDKMYSLYQTECQNYNPPQKPVSNHIFL